jgi:hypothetical protein
MPLPVAHGLVGASIVAVMSSRDPARLEWRALSLGAVLAICPDFDVFFSVVLGFGGSWHGSFSHSITFATLVGLLVPWVLGISPVRSNLRFVAATASHGFLDALTGKELHAGEEIQTWPARLLSTWPTERAKCPSNCQGTVERQSIRGRCVRAAFHNCDPSPRI